MDYAQVQETFDLFRLWAKTHSVLGSPRFYFLLILAHSTLLCVLPGNVHSLSFRLILL